MADQITLVQGGRIVQQGTPRELYQQPVDVFAARFLGTGHVIDLVPERHAGLLDALGMPKEPARVMVRPEAVLHSPDSDLRLAITACTFRGAGTLFELVLDDGQRVEALITGHQPASPGETLPVRFNSDLVVTLPN